MQRLFFLEVLSKITTIFDQVSTFAYSDLYTRDTYAKNVTKERHRKCFLIYKIDDYICMQREKIEEMYKQQKHGRTSKISQFSLGKEKREK